MGLIGVGAVDKHLQIKNLLSSDTYRLRNLAFYYPTDIHIPKGCLQNS